MTSWLFDGSTLDMDRLRQLSESIDGRRFLVVDLSCKSTNNGWNVVTEKWQRSTDITLCTELFESLSEYCAEFLVHAADVEGLIVKRVCFTLHL